MTPATLTRTDLGIGTVIALLMAGAFTWIGGQPLISTFVPGLLVSWAVFLWMQLKQVRLPDGRGLYPLYFGVLAWQFLHFTEEFMTGFRVQFPALFGAGPFSAEFFVGINMVSYFLFTMAFIGTFAGGRRFLLVPVLFFVVYGALGNAIAHTYWVIDQAGYFPGFFTAQLYWVLGILLLARIGTSWRMAITATCGFSVLLVGVLAMTMQAA